MEVIRTVEQSDPPVRKTLQQLDIPRSMFYTWCRRYLEGRQIEHTQGKPYHPMTKGKIERYHRTMKNVIKLQQYWFPEELERNIAAFVEWYNTNVSMSLLVTSHRTICTMESNGKS